MILHVFDADPACSGLCCRPLGIRQDSFFEHHQVATESFGCTLCLCGSGSVGRRWKALGAPWWNLAWVLELLFDEPVEAGIRDLQTSRFRLGAEALYTGTLKLTSATCFRKVPVYFVGQRTVNRHWNQFAE